MKQFSALAIFCEDIRQEKSGQATIIGIIPDNIGMKAIPGMIPKLGIYVRVHADPKTIQGPMSARLQMSDGSSIPLGEIDNTIIAKSKQEAVANNMPYVGLLLMSLISPFPVNAEGKITAIIRIENTDYESGVINIVKAK